MNIRSKHLNKISNKYTVCFNSVKVAIGLCLCLSLVTFLHKNSELTIILSSHNSVINPLLQLIPPQEVHQIPLPLFCQKKFHCFDNEMNHSRPKMIQESSSMIIILAPPKVD